MKMISKFNVLFAVCMMSSMFALEDPTNVCATGSELEDTYGVLQAAVTTTWEDSNPAEGCGDGEVEDCDGSGECWPASWIGDNYPDCNDQQYGADLTCYDCDGGDCPATDPGCDGTDGGTTGGATTGGATTGGGTTTGGTTGGSDPACDDCVNDFSTYGSECCDSAWTDFGITCAALEANYNWDCTGCNCPGDVVGADSDQYVPGLLAVTDELPNKLLLLDNYVDVRTLDQQDEIPQNRSILGVLTYSCVACLDQDGDGTLDDWTYTWEASTSLGETGFSVYGFEYGTSVDVTVSLYSNISGDTSQTVGPVTAIAGDADSQDCFGGCSTAGTGDVNLDGSTNVLDIVAIVNVILGTSELDDCGLETADLNGDGAANVLDIVSIVNLILGGRVVDATSVELNKDSNSLTMRANGYIGGIQMTLSHGSDFVLDITDDAMVADYLTTGNTTTLVIVKPESNELFTANSDFVIKDMIVANSQGAMNVAYAPQSISLDRAYPNPFNPSTTINMNLHQDGFVSVKIYNLMGQEIATLSEGNMIANTYSLTWDAKDVPTGVYMVRAESAGHVETQKLMLLK